MKPKKIPIAAPSSKKPDVTKITLMTRKSRNLFPSRRVIPVVLLVLLVLVVLFIWYRLSLLPVDPGSTAQKIFVVPEGQSTHKILTRLENEKLIKSSLAVKIYLKLSNEGGSLQAGSFRLSPSQTAPTIIEDLKHGTLDAWITIPEGWRSEQIVDELIALGLLSDIPKPDLYQQFHKEEGLLFPDTYLFAKDSGPNQIIDRLTATFRQKTADLNLSQTDVTLASLVEREAKHQPDRPKVAAVLKNRLKIGMALQVDATVQFALANWKFKVQSSKFKVQENNFNWWEAINPDNKSIESPYNTYKYLGLPPGPIANPGLSSIKAVLSPMKVDYLYYLSEPDGTTHYANTLTEHNDNIRKYLR